jgi:hypothetical protein
MNLIKIVPGEEVAGLIRKVLFSLGSFIDESNDVKYRDNYVYGGW